MHKQLPQLQLLVVSHADARDFERAFTQGTASGLSISSVAHSGKTSKSGDKPALQAQAKGGASSASASGQSASRLILLVLRRSCFCHLLISVLWISQPGLPTLMGPLQLPCLMQIGRNGSAGPLPVVSRVMQSMELCIRQRERVPPLPSSLQRIKSPMTTTSVPITTCSGSSQHHQWCTCPYYSSHHSCSNTLLHILLNSTMVLHILHTGTR